MYLRKIQNNFHVVEMFGYKTWFSYETPIAYQTNDGTIVVSENKWSRTTGVHINYLKRNYPNCIQVSNEVFLEKIGGTLAVNNGGIFS